MPHNIPKLFLALILTLSLTAICRPQEKNPAAELAARMVEAKTEGERAALLAEKKELQTPEFVLALVAQGPRLAAQKKFQEAEAIYQLARKVAEGINDRAGVVAAINATGQLYEVQGKFDSALTFYEQGLAIVRETKDQAKIAETLYNIGQIHNVRGNLDTAAKFYQESLKLREDLRDKAGMGDVLNRLGVLQSKRGNFAGALELYQQSLTVREGQGNRSQIAATYNNIGNAYHGQGLYDLALENFQKSVAEYDAAKNRRGMAMPLSNIGSIYRFKGNYALALEHQQKSLTIREEVGDKQGLAYTLLNMGEAYRLQGNDELAIDHYQRSKKLFEELGIKIGIGTNLNNLGIVHFTQGNYESALDFHRQALEQLKDEGDKPVIAETLDGIGQVYLAQQSFGRALEFFQKALKLGEESNDPQRTSEILSSVATAYLSQGNLTPALESADRAARLASKLGYSEGLWRAHAAQGRIYLALKKPEEAQVAFSQAITVIEAVRTQVSGGEQERQQFFESRVSPYYAMVELLVRQNKFYEALAFAERAKGRVLLDVLQSGRTNIDKSLTATEQAQERKLVNQLTALNAQITRARQQNQPDVKRLNDLEQSLEAARHDYEAFEAVLYTTHPELKVRRGEQRALQLAQVAEIVPDIKTTILEFVVTDERTYLFVLTKSSGQTTADLKVYPIEIKRKELTDRVEGFRRALAERDPAFKEPARKLHDLLLAPARAQLRGRNVLIVVPDDALWELPFQALQSTPNRYLLEESAISYAPSLSVLYEMKQQQKQGGAAGDTTLLAFGNPIFGDVAAERTKATLRSGTKPEPLPEAEKEVKMLAEIYGLARSRVYTGAEAREELAKTEAGKFRVLHFATHGVLNNASPMYSHLLMSQSGSGEDGLLEAWEIMKLDLKADLVVLSACETARGRVGAGEGMIGLTWALFVAGSPATLVSQWKVESLATKELMLDFHRNLRMNPGSRPAQSAKAEALRQAALKLMKSATYSHPFYWASFVVVGDGR